MTHIIQDFSKWKRVNEDKVRQKVVATPIDKQNLKLKLINFSGVLDASSKLTQAGFDELLTWIKSQVEIIQYYPALNDLKSNIVVYSVGKDSDRKDLINFNIGPKAAIGGISPELQFVRADELGLAKQGKLFKGGAGSDQKPEILTSQTKVGFTLPFSSEGIKDSTDLKIIEFIKGAYLKVKMDSTAAANPIMAKVKAELNAKKLGGASRAFIVGLNAAYGIKDWSGDETETAITQKLVDALAKVKAAESKEFFLGLDAQALMETVSTILPGFDIDEFNNGIANAFKSSAANVGDIKVPSDGFRYGIRGDQEFKKFQDILVKHLPTYAGGILKNKSQVKNFISATPMKGDYGDRTKKLILYLKAGLSDPKYPDNDAQVVKADFIERMLKEFKLVGESNSFLGLDGLTVVSEGFDEGVADTVAGSGNRGGGDDKVKKKEESVGDSQIYELQSQLDWEYTLKKDLWHARKKGSKSAWFILQNPTSIKKLISTYKKGYYINIKKQGDGSFKRIDDRIYQFNNKKWEVKISGIWQSVEDPTSLTAAYGSNPATSSSTDKTVTPKSGTAAIDEEILNLGRSIKKFVEKPGTFGAYVAGNDDEEGAWNEVLYPEWTNNWKKKVGSLRTKIKSDATIKESDKARYSTSLNTISKMFSDFSTWSTGSFYLTFLGSESYDDWDLKLLLSGSRVERIKIQTDFEQ